MGESEYEIYADGAIEFAEGYILSEDDISFLKGVERVNSNPSEFRGRDDKDGVAAATVGRIARASSLDRDGVKYRFDEKVFSDIGYVRDHPTPEDTPRGDGSRSVELTLRGKEVVETIRELQTNGGLPTPEVSSPGHVESDVAGFGANGVEAVPLDQSIDSMVQLREEIQELIETLDSGGADQELIALLDRFDSLAQKMISEHQRMTQKVDSLEEDVDELEDDIESLESRTKDIDVAVMAHRLVVHHTLGVDTDILYEKRGDFSREDLETVDAQVARSFAEWGIDLDPALTDLPESSDDESGGT